MADLETLRPEVAEAVAAIDGGNGVFVDSDDGIGNEKWTLVRAELLGLAKENRILEVKNAGTLANNLCPDHRDKQVGKPCLACTIETLTREKEHAEAELAALKARIAEAPIALVYASATRIPCGHVNKLPAHLIGKRVRLVVEE